MKKSLIIVMLFICSYMVYGVDCADNEAPEFKIVSPYDEFTVQNSLGIGWEFEDNDGPLEPEVYLFYSVDNGDSWDLITKQPATQGYSAENGGAYLWDTSGLSLSEVNLLAVLYDGCTAVNSSVIGTRIGSAPEFSTFGYIMMLAVLIGGIIILRKKFKNPKKRK